MAGVSHLARLSLATIGRPPYVPVILVADRVATGPELRRDAGVGGVFDHLPQFALLDLIGQLRAELEVEPLVVNAPALVGDHVDALVSIGDEVV